MTIKHLILSGGGPAGIIQYSVLRYLNLTNNWKYEDLSSIYSTSIGCVTGLMILLNFDWKTMDDYLIKRPWEKIFNTNLNDYFNLMYAKGFFDINHIKKMIDPLLLSKDLDLNITMKELNDIYKIDYHIFTVDIYKMKSIDMNYETHGNYRLIDCIYMSCCFPIFMKPCFINDNLYLDGGILNNCPYYSCLDKYECRISELLILTNVNSDASFKNNFREKTNRFIKYNNDNDNTYNVYNIDYRNDIYNDVKKYLINAKKYTNNTNNTNNVIGNDVSNDVSNNIDDNVSNDVSNDVDDNVSNDVDDNVSNDIDDNVSNDVDNNISNYKNIINYDVYNNLNDDNVEHENYDGENYDENYDENNNTDNILNKNTNIIYFFIFIFKKIASKLLVVETTIFGNKFLKKYKYKEELHLLDNIKINCSFSKTSAININLWLTLLSNIENRKELIFYGNILACDYLYNLENLYNK